MLEIDSSITPAFANHLPLTTLETLRVTLVAVGWPEEATSLDVLSAVKTKLDADCGTTASYLSAIVNAHMQTRHKAAILLRAIAISGDAYQLAQHLIQAPNASASSETIASLCARLEPLPQADRQEH